MVLTLLAILAHIVSFFLLGPLPLTTSFYLPSSPPHFPLCVSTTCNTTTIPCIPYPFPCALNCTSTERCIIHTLFLAACPTAPTIDITALPGCARKAVLRRALERGCYGLLKDCMCDAGWEDIGIYVECCPEIQEAVSAKQWWGAVCAVGKEAPETVVLAGSGTAADKTTVVGSQETVVTNPTPSGNTIAPDKEHTNTAEAPELIGRMRTRYYVLQVAILCMSGYLGVVIFFESMRDSTLGPQRL